MPTAPLFFALMLLPFLVPVLAGHTRSLWKFSVVSFLPATALAAAALLPGGGANFALFLGAFISAVSGTFARRMSLIARGLGHARPFSFWIEAAFLGLAVSFLLLAGLP